MNSHSRLLIGYSSLFVVLSALCWMAFAGNHAGDSPDRIIPYLLFSFVLPATVAAFIIDLVLSICSRDQRRRAIPFAFAGGLLGPGWLGISIATSTDPESRMGYLAMPLVYFAAAAIAGVLAMLVIKVHDHRQISKNA